MTHPENPFQSAAWGRYEKDVRENLIPKLRESALTLSIAPKGATDVKFAVELGMSIMLGKPIIVIAEDEDDVVPGLRKVAEAVIVGDFMDPDVQRQVAEAIKDIPTTEGEQ